jgi:hypothetical protein
MERYKRLDKLPKYISNVTISPKRQNSFKKISKRANKRVYKKIRNLLNGELELML